MQAHPALDPCPSSFDTARIPAVHQEADLAQAILPEESEGNPVLGMQAAHITE